MLVHKRSANCTLNFESCNPLSKVANLKSLYVAGKEHVFYYIDNDLNASFPSDGLLAYPDSTIGEVVKKLWKSYENLRFKRMLIRYLYESKRFSFSDKIYEYPTDCLLECSDEELGDFIRSSWTSGQHVKFKNGLFRAVLCKLDIPPYALCAIGMVQSGEVESDSSGVPNVGTDASSVVVTKETVEFHDSNEGEVLGHQSIFDTLTSGDDTSEAGLASFLSRPVQIAQFQWLESDNVGIKTSIYPWALWAANPVVQLKFQNFAFFRANLKVKVLINASPFYYGAMYMNYLPYPGNALSTIENNDSGNTYLIPMSQRPGLWILPQDQHGGELGLPFFYNRNMLETSTNADWENMGYINFLVYQTLANANSITDRKSVV